MPDFVAGLLIGNLVGIFIGGFLGVVIMCVVRIHNANTIIKSMEQGKDADELV